MSNKEYTNDYKSILFWLKVIFYLTVSFGTIYNGYSLYKQSTLIFQPVIGITEVKAHRHLMPGTKDTYANVIGASVEFFIENVGNLPAKNVFIKPSGKIGVMNIATEESNDKMGIVLVQKAKQIISVTISKEDVEKMLISKEKCFYTLEINYSDWKNYNKYNYKTSFEISIANKEPLILMVKGAGEIH
jgi:hypothetical protein